MRSIVLCIVTCSLSLEYTDSWGFLAVCSPQLHTVLICVIDVFQCAHVNVLILQIDDQCGGGYVLCMHSTIVYNQDNLCE